MKQLTNVGFRRPGIAGIVILSMVAGWFGEIAAERTPWTNGRATDDRHLRSTRSAGEDSKLSPGGGHLESVAYDRGDVDLSAGDPRSEEPSHVVEVRKRSGPSSALRYVGLGKRQSAMKYIGLGKRYNATPMRYIGLGKKSSLPGDYVEDGDGGQVVSRRESAMRYIGLGRRKSPSSAMSYIGLGRRDANPLRYIGIGRRGDGATLTDDPSTLTFADDVEEDRSETNDLAKRDRVRVLRPSIRGHTMDPGLLMMGIGRK